MYILGVLLIIGDGFGVGFVWVLIDFGLGWIVVMDVDGIDM